MSPDPLDQYRFTVWTPTGPVASTGSLYSTMAEAEAAARKSAAEYPALTFFISELAGAYTAADVPVREIQVAREDA